jgi:hypothetical protein
MLHLVERLDRGLTVLIKFLNRLYLSFFFRSGYALRISRIEKNINLLVTLIDKVKTIDRYKEFLSILQVKTPENIEMKIFGPKNDGSYVLANDFILSKTVISLGVGKNIDLELSLANLGLDVYLCDGTVPKLPIQHKNFHFINKNVYGKLFSTDMNIQSISINKLFSDIQDKLGPSTEKILLIDIEGSEYDVIENIDLEYLMSCRQLTIEFHEIFENLKSSNSNLVKATKKLMKYFELVSVHGNNYGAYLSEDNQDYADVIETTWLRKDIDVFRPGKNEFNVELCNPNNPKDKDLYLIW